MEALNTTKLIYLRWRPDVSTVFEMEYDNEVYLHNLNIAKEIYACDKLTKPSALPKPTKEKKSVLESYCKSATFLGEFESVKVLDGHTPCHFEVQFFFS